MTKRDPALDVAKGLMMVLLVYHHFFYNAGMQGVASGALSTLGQIQRVLCTCYFMQAFFLISGMVSNFDLKAKDFVVRQMRGLLLPGLCFLLAAEFIEFHDLNRVLRVFPRFIAGRCFAMWFLYALFVGKVVYYVFRRLVKSRMAILMSLSALSFAGTLIPDSLATRSWSLLQACDMVLFVAIGAIFKDALKQPKVGKCALLVYGTTCCIGVLTIGWNLPSVTAGYNTSFMLQPLHILLAFSGSAAILEVARWISQNSVLGFIGQNTLLYYLSHNFVIAFIVAAYAERLRAAEIWDAIMVIVFTIVSVCACCGTLAIIVNRTPLCVFIGKRWVWNAKSRVQ